MFDFLENVKLFIGAHRVASIAVAGVVGVSAVGAGGYAIYNHFSNVEVISDEQVAEAINNDDVYIPEFKTISITGESLEKDLTLYISDENDECITGTQFQIKLISPEDAESLQEYIDAINEVNSQINEYVSSSDTSSDTTDSDDSDDSALPVDGGDIDYSNDSDDSSDESSEDTSEDSDSDSTDTESEKSAAEILAERNPDVTVTDEDGEVVETLQSSIKDDPLYELYLDKETAIQAFAVALNDIEGTVYTDDDADGIIAESDMEPGDYVACIVDDASADVLLDPTDYAVDVEVKDKIEYKVVEEITKEIKADVASEDGQKTEVTQTEATLTDTVEYVASSKVSNGSSYEATTDAVAPTSTASSSKATVKSGGVTSVTHDVTTTSKVIGKTKKAAVALDKAFFSNFRMVVRAAEDNSASAITVAEEGTTEETTKTQYTVTIKYIDSDGNSIKDSKSEKLDDGTSYSYSAPSIDGYTLTSDSTVSGTVSGADVTVTFKYKKNETTKYTVTVKYVDASGTSIKDTITETKESGASYEYSAPSIDGYTLTSDSKYSGTVSADTTITFTYKKNTTTTTTTEKATLDMSYSAGTFTIKATTNVGSVTVNGTAVTMSSGTGTFKATGNGDYVLKGVATFSDGVTDSTLTVTYTVSGYGSSSTDKLVDSSGNQLYLDEACTKAATAADYVSGKTYYIKVESYTYYGWQTINGITYYYDKNGHVVTGTQVIQGVTYNFGSDGALLVNGTGIDVSKYQGNIDWSQASSAVSFAIIRCGYRGMYDGALHEDPYFYKNMKNAKANGVKTGIYIYSTALNEAEAVQEASMAVAMANKAGGCSYPIYIDMEDSTRGVKSLSNAQRNAIITAFCSTVQSAGYKAGVYANKTWMTNYIDVSSLPSSCYIWVAQYNTSCTYSGKYSMWQYSSKGSVPGISGNVDMNKSYF